LRDLAASLVKAAANSGSLSNPSAVSMISLAADEDKTGLAGFFLGTGFCNASSETRTSICEMLSP